MSEGRKVTEYDGLIAVIRDQMGALGMTGDQLDRIANLPDRLGGKILGSKRVRGLANETFGRVLEGTGLEILVIESPEKAERVRQWLKKWGQNSKARPRLRTIARTKRATWLMTSKDARRNARKSWEKRTPAERAQWARRMNKKRWKLHRKKKREAKRRDVERRRADRLARAECVADNTGQHIIAPCSPGTPEPSTPRSSGDTSEGATAARAPSPRLPRSGSTTSPSCFEGATA